MGCICSKARTETHEESGEACNDQNVVELDGIVDSDSHESDDDVPDGNAITRPKPEPSTAQGDNKTPKKTGNPIRVIIQIKDGFNEGRYVYPSKLKIKVDTFNDPNKVPKWTRRQQNDNYFKLSHSYKSKEYLVTANGRHIHLKKAGKDESKTNFELKSATHSEGEKMMITTSPNTKRYVEATKKKKLTMNSKIKYATSLEIKEA
uniref:uncharacterized protein LOC120347489 n=1 Tax=Styela clava TaxID=7725 RepID=UPI0019393A1F|nr:uncharacterized protein LOC120347489 [Styela clava]